MVTSRFQLGLIATLAVGLGFSLASSQAIGYPAGPVASLGTNPLWSQTGTVGRGDTSEGVVNVLTVPEGQVAVVTGFSALSVNLDLYQGTGLVLEGHSKVATDSKMFDQGNGNLVIQPGTSLKISNSWCCTGNYAYYIEGYYAQP